MNIVGYRCTSSGWTNLTEPNVQFVAGTVRPVLRSYTAATTTPGSPGVDA